MTEIVENFFLVSVIQKFITEKIKTEEDNIGEFWEKLIYKS